MTDAITALVAALGQVLIMIFIGFASAKLKLVPPGSAGGIGLLVGTFALPAVFLCNAAQMDIASFDLRVLFGVVLARYMMVAIASGASRLLDHGNPNPKGAMGIYAIFCTQSNDVAIGLPIVKAIYPYPEHPANYPGYLILVSTLQIVLINPVCIALLEWGKSEIQSQTAPNTGEPKRSIFLTVARGVITSPLVLGSLAGIIINVSCGRDCLTSGLAGDTLGRIGDAFTFCALFLTGMSMDASPTPGTSSRTQEPPTSTTQMTTIVAALVLGKSLILPIVIRLSLYAILPSPDDDLKDVFDFAYLYGTLPVASLPVVLANQHKLKSAVVAFASVASTFASMPLLLVSSAIFMSPGSDNIYLATRYVSKSACVVSILSLMALAGVHRYNKQQWSVEPMHVVCMLGLSQFFFHCTLLACENATGDEGGTHLLYWVVFYCRGSMNTWLSNLALYFVLLARCRYSNTRPIPLWVLHLFGWLFPALLSVVGWLVGGPKPQNELYPYRATCWYLTTDQIYPDLALTILYFLTFVLMFVLERRAANYTIIEAPPGECGVDSSSDTPKDDCLEHFDTMSKAALDEQLSIGYATRVKTILAVGFIRLCFILALQIQMLNHVDPDGSFSVSLLFAVLLVDGGGMITALTFLLQNPVLSEILHRLTSTVCKEDGLEGPRSAGVPWLGEEEDGQLQRRRTLGAFGYGNLTEQEDPDGRERSQSYQVRRTSGAIVIDAENGAKSSYEERLIPRTASSATH